MVNDISPITHRKRFPDIVIGNQDPDILSLQGLYDVLDIIYGQGIDSRKRFIKEEKEGEVTKARVISTRLRSPPDRE